MGLSIEVEYITDMQKVMEYGVMCRAAFFMVWEVKMVHQYQLNGYNIVLDTCSGSVHVVDDVAYDVIAMYAGPHPRTRSCLP